MEATAKNVNQLTYELRNNEIEREYRNRQFAVTRDYNEERAAMADERKRREDTYFTNRDAVLKQLEDVIMERNELKRKGVMSFAVEFEINSRQERMYQRELADLKKEFADFKERFRRQSAQMFERYQADLKFNADWRSVEINKNITAMRDKLAALVGNPELQPSEV